MPSDPIAWLLALEQFGIKFGLESITTILTALGHPERSLTTIHIAGTNGKGSVTAMVDAALRAAGHRSARYTSPHLVSLTERFVIDGAPVRDEDLAQAIADIRDVVERLVADGQLEALPTFFEVTTAAAWELFRRASARVAVCEVGLGGRLDATNVIQPAACAITSIGMDHERYLGTTLTDVAAEKAGIIKPGVPVVVGHMDANAFETIAATARRVGAPLIDAAAGVMVEPIARRDAWSPTRIRLRTPARDYGEVALALPGRHQIDNAVVAVRTLETLDASGVPVPAASIVHGLAGVTWPGRLDVRTLADGREILLDAAHNPDGAAALARFLRESGTVGRPLVFAAMADKDVRGMLRALAPATSLLVLTRAFNRRSADPAALAELARELAPELAIIVRPDPRDAVDAAWAAAPSIVVAGSIFLLGDVLRVLETS